MPSSPTPEEIKLLELAARHAIAEEGARSERERVEGKLSARERINTLLDEGTFEETGKFVTHRATECAMSSQRPPGDGVVTGYGRIHGRTVCVFAHDATVLDGSLSEANSAKVVRLIDAAIRIGSPLVGLYDSTGARVQEGIAALAGSVDILLRHTLAGGVIPQIAAILGPCAGVAALATALADFTLRTPAAIPGEAHILPDNDRHCLASVRELLTFLPSSYRDTAPHKPTSDDPFRADSALDILIPVGDDPYDMLEAIARIVDHDDTGKGCFFQLHEHFARNILTGFARMHGRVIGIVANQPAVLAGALDGDACTKAARFVRFCDAFNISLITFADTPGFLPGLDPKHAAQLLYAFAEATVPRFTVVARKAYGAAYGIMGSKHLQADLNLAWPTAEIAAAEPEAAIDSLYQHELESLVRRAQAIMPQGVSLSEEQKLDILAEARKEKVEEYRERFANPYAAAERGYVDAVIRPSETRRRLNTALDMLDPRRDKNTPKKHGNIPL